MKIAYSRLNVFISKLFFFRHSSLNETRMKEQMRTRERERERERIEVIFIGYVTARDDEGKRCIHACGIPECTRKSATNRFSQLSPSPKLDVIP